jgi:hypothetical protein
MNWADIVGVVGGVTGIASTLYARQTARSTREADHERLGPPVITSANEFTPEPFILKGLIVLPRDYRVVAEGVFYSGGTVNLDLTGGTVNLDIPTLLKPGHDLTTLLKAGRPYEFEICQWQRDFDEFPIQELLLKFWPPVATDEVEYWSCPCGRPIGPTGGYPRGHWERRVKVATPADANPR